MVWLYSSGWRRAAWILAPPSSLSPSCLFMAVLYLIMCSHSAHHHAIAGFDGDCLRYPFMLKTIKSNIPSSVAFTVKTVFSNHLLFRINVRIQLINLTKRFPKDLQLLVYPEHCCDTASGKKTALGWFRYIFFLYFFSLSSSPLTLLRKANIVVLNHCRWSFCYS